LKPKYYVLLSIFAFNFNLRRYSKGAAGASGGGGGANPSAADIAAGRAGGGVGGGASGGADDAALCQFLDAPPVKEAKEKSGLPHFRFAPKVAPKAAGAYTCALFGSTCAYFVGSRWLRDSPQSIKQGDTGRCDQHGFG